MAFTLAALKSELLTDPSGLGYAASVTSRDDSITATLINLARAAIQIKRADVSSAELVNAIDVADYASLPISPSSSQLSTERRFLSWLECVSGLTEGRIRLLNDDGSDAPAITNFKAMFAVGTGTRTRLTALSMRDGSRAEQLFGPGTIITAIQVGQALQS